MESWGKLEQRLQGSKRINHVDIERKDSPGRGNRKCKNPESRTGSPSSNKSHELTWQEEKWGKCGVMRWRTEQAGSSQPRSLAVLRTLTSILNEWWGNREIAEEWHHWTHLSEDVFWCCVMNKLQGGKGRSRNLIEGYPSNTGNRWCWLRLGW